MEPRWPQGSPRQSQKVPKMTSRCPQSVSRNTQNHTKTIETNRKNSKKNDSKNAPKWPEMTAIPPQYDPNVCRNIRKWAKMTPRQYQNAPKAPAKWHQYGRNKAQKGHQDDSKNDLKMSLAMTLNDSKTPKMTPKLLQVDPRNSPEMVETQLSWLQKCSEKRAMSFIAHPFCHFRVNFVVIFLGSFPSHFLWSFCGHHRIVLRSFWARLISFWFRFVVISWLFCDHLGVILRAFGTIPWAFLGSFSGSFWRHF